MPILQTQRLALRAWKSDDAAMLFENSRDADIAHGCDHRPFESREEALTAIETAYTLPDTWAVTLKDGHPIGFVSLIADTERASRAGTQAEICFWISRHHRGEGYATEAAEAALAYGFGTKGYDSVSCNIFGLNDKPMKTAIRLGFEYAFVEKARLYDGTITSLVYTALTEESYRYRHRFDSR